MASEQVKFKRGLSTGLPDVPCEAGTLLVATDTGAAYVDDSSTARIQLKDTTKLLPSDVLVSGAITKTPGTNNQITLSHSTSAGYKHIPTGGSSGQILKWSASGTAEWKNEYSYTHPSHTAYSSGLYKVTVNALGHVTSATAVVKSDITALGIPGSNTHYTSGTVVNSSTTSTSNTTAALTNGNVFLNHVENGSVQNSHKIHGEGITTVTADASGNIIIKSPGYSTSAGAAGSTSGSAGSANTLSRGDHSHPLQTTVSGNAGSATKLQTARTIDGVSFDGSAAITHYGVCSTADTTAAKAVSITGFSLVTGAKIAVKFANGNTMASPTLNVNSTGAKPIHYNGAALAGQECVIVGGAVLEFIYNGSQYDLLGGINVDTDTNTTYAAGNGLTLSGTTFNVGQGAGISVTADAIALATSGVTAASYGPSANASPAHSGTFSVPYITVDAYGRVTSASTKTITLPASGNTDTHYTSKNIVGTSSTASANGAVTGTGGVYLNHIESNSTTPTSTHKIVGAGSVKVTSDSSGNITITGTDNNTTYSIANASTAGLVKPVSVISAPTAQSVTTTSGRYYQVTMDSSGKMYVNVPWTDNNTVYTHPNSGVTAGTYKTVTVNATGHVTAGSNPTHTHEVSYTPKGDVSSTFTGTSTASGGPSDTTDVYSITSVGSAASLTASVSAQRLTFTFTANTVPTRSAVTVPKGTHTHNVTATGSVESSFSGSPDTVISGVDE